jgi:cardiolipin synthase
VSTKPAFLVWLPNLITLARLLSVPVMVYLMLQGAYQAAFWVFLCAGLSDALDGFLAKRLGLTSLLGSVLDPIADKALLVGAYVTLGYLGYLPDWLVILVVFRDLLIVGGAAVYHYITQKLTMQPLLVSKLNTAVQIALVGAVLADLGLGPEIGGLEIGKLVVALMWGVAATTFVSGAAYVLVWGRRAFEMEQS